VIKITKCPSWKTEISVVISQ